MKHTVRIPPHEFTRIKDGSKTFVVADDETGFQHGDELLLAEYDRDAKNPTDSTIPKGLTGEHLTFKIGYIQKGRDGAILSLLKLVKPSRKKA